MYGREILFGLLSFDFRVDIFQLWSLILLISDNSSAVDLLYNLNGNYENKSHTMMQHVIYT
jgi:hypothetical protein